MFPVYFLYFRYCPCLAVPKIHTYAVTAAMVDGVGLKVVLTFFLKTSASTHIRGSFASCFLILFWHCCVLWHFSLKKFWMPPFPRTNCPQHCCPPIKWLWCYIKHEKVPWCIRYQALPNRIWHSSVAHNVKNILLLSKQFIDGGWYKIVCKYKKPGKYPLKWF